MKNIIYSVLLTSSILAFLVGLSGCKTDIQGNMSSVENTITGTITDPEKYTDENNTGEKIITASPSPIPDFGPISKADYITPHGKTLGWWDNWTRFANYITPDKTLDIRADASEIFAGHDEGRGPFGREYSYQTYTKNYIQEFKDFKLNFMVWLECQGTCTNFMVALNKLPDGSFEMDSNSGAPKVTSQAWSWPYDGPDVNKSANYIVWNGMHSFVNNETWLGKYILKNYSDVKTPSYPNGTPAVGYLSSLQAPHTAKLYDACCAKDINGKLLTGYADIIDYSPTQGYTIKSPDGTTSEGVKVLDFPKDIAAGNFWLSYTRNAAAYWLKKGANGFWVDNFNGWDSISDRPIYRAFGDWSIYAFRDFLKKHPEIGIKDTKNFDIVKYLKDKYKIINPEGDPSDLSSSNISWQDKQWLNDKVWMAYLSYKSLQSTDYQTKFYNIIKEEAKKAGKNPDDIMVGTNDFPTMNYAAYQGSSDIIHTEYIMSYSPATKGNAVGYPPNSYAGGTYNLLADTARSKGAVVWTYADQYPNNYNLGLVAGYEALAYNCTVYTGDNIPRVVGTDRSGNAVNKSIGILKDYFGQKERYAEIGVVYSANSELSTMAPGGLTDFDKNPADIAYMGWCHAFDELNIPYRSVQEYRLKDRIKSLSLVILPNMRSISKNMINDVLKPFLDSGGTLVITGEDAGAVSARDELYTPYGSNLLVDLAKSYKGKGKIIYYETDPVFEYYLYHDKYEVSDLQDYLNTIRNMISALYHDKRLNKLIEVNGLSESVITTLGYDPDAKTFFADIVNMEYNADTDKVTPQKAGAKIKMRLPSSLWGKKLQVLMFNAEQQKIIPLKENSQYKVNKDFLEVTLDAFQIYRSVIIRAVK